MTATAEQPPPTTTKTTDEWVFGLSVPPNLRERHGRSVFLKQRQPESSIGSHNKNDPDDTSASGGEYNRSQQEEVEQLLLPQSPSSASSPHGLPAWNFSSPFWKIQSNTLLTISYCLAWQNIPEYTNTACAQSYCCQGVASPAIHFVSETLSTSDIVTITRTTENITGLGVCDALSVHLRPLDVQDILVPEYLRDAWQERLERIQKDNASSLSFEASDRHDKLPHNGPVLTFALPKYRTDPPLVWKVQLPACHDVPISVHTLTIFDGLLTTEEHENPTHLYVNGYQSWSFAGSVPKGMPQPSPALPHVFSKAFNEGGSGPVEATTLVGSDTLSETFQKFYQSDFFCCVSSDGTAAPRGRLRRRPPQQFAYQELDETGGPALLLGWLSQHQQFGVIQADAELQQYQMHCSVDGQLLLANVNDTIATDWSYAQLIHPHNYDEEPMANYLNTVSNYNFARPLQNGSLLTGWCSWYVFYEKINASILRENFVQLNSMRDQVPTNVSVVDDGYMTAWGDWDSLKPKQFPDGMEVVSRDIGSQAMRPGLWLAPFAADKHSQIAKDHPDWIIQNNNGIASNSSNCGKFFYGLDATHPEVRHHVTKTIQMAVREWNFNVLKIDFLYAACLAGNSRFNMSKSRAQAMHEALQTIRNAAGPDTFLIGCGCPIATGIGYMDAMRISCDTGPTWYPAPPLPWWDNGTLPSLRGMIRNSISRAPFGHRFWHNDPDCIMLGEHTRLTDEEIGSAASVVAMTCGMLLLSDNLPKVSQARMSIVSKIFPLTGVSATVLDLHSTNDGLPSLMRLWCTDKYGVWESLNESNLDLDDHNAEATFFARRSSSVNLDEDELPNPSERRRNCVHVARGLGTWTIISISNWSNKAAVVRVPPPALRLPPKSGWTAGDSNNSNSNSNEDEMDCTYGYHVFGFWSSKYSWLESVDENNEDPDHTVCKRLGPHETEIYHVKQVTPDTPQYIGSDFHFSCGTEVRQFRVTANSVSLLLKNRHKRSGTVFCFIPRINTDHVVKVLVQGQKTPFSVVGTAPRGNGQSPHLVGRVLGIPVVIHGDQREGDGQVLIEF